MSSPVLSKSASSLRRKRLADRVERAFNEMPSPCSRCSSRGLKCLVDLSSGRCSECIRSGRKCDLVVTDSDWDSLHRAQRVVKEQLDVVETQHTELLARHTALLAQLANLAAQSSSLVAESESLGSRRLRLRKQAGLLTDREKEMTLRELASIEEMEKLEAESAVRKSSLLAVSEGQQFVDTEGVSLGSFDFDAFLKGSDFADPVVDGTRASSPEAASAVS